MKLLFLTMTKFESLDGRGIYIDLLNHFQQKGHEIFVVAPTERRLKLKTNIRKSTKITILNVKTLNLQKTSLIEKGIGQLLLEYQYLNAIKKHFKNEKFDLVFYSTPPITFSKVIRFIKNRDQAYSYLLLKDIFPQNAVDMNMLKENGILHKVFLKKEKELYALSDTIGCMSKANKNFILDHNLEVVKERIEVNPNTILPIPLVYSNGEKLDIRKKYDLPLYKKIFVYGGNLGIPQGIDFLLEIIEANKNTAAYFLIIGSGTQYQRIVNWFENKKPINAKLLAGLSKVNFDKLLASCDVGMIFLHKDFTIPNFPSRLLSYLEMSMPIFAATDVNTDIGEVIEKVGCGFWAASGDLPRSLIAIEKLCNDDIMFKQMKKNAWELLISEYTVDKSYDLIMEKLKVS